MSPKARRVGRTLGRIVGLARVTEISARSDKSFEDALRVGVEPREQYPAQRHLRLGEGAARGRKDGRIQGYQVNLLVTFVLDE